MGVGSRMKGRTDDRQQTVAVVGLGYVGLPLAVLASEKGFKVIGIDHNKKRVASLNHGTNTLKDESSLDPKIAAKPFRTTTNYSAVRQADFIIICVPTPVDEFYKPELGPVIEAATGISKNMRRSQVIILESTVNPGVSEEIVLPILSKSGLKVGRDFELAHCPERINPGDPKWNVGNIPRCVGATTKRGAEKTANFYRQITSGGVRVMKSLKEAEATKIVENSFRDVNIAFVNELARSFDKLGIDVKDVIDGAATKPFAFMAHYPSIGVGGHCIPVDPYYLIERAWRAGFDHKFLRLAREINNNMPSYGVIQLQELLNRLGRSLNGAAVGLLGMSYKANVGDIRESPSLKVKELLEHFGAKVVTYDPFLSKLSTTKSLNQALARADVLIVAVNHAAFYQLSGAKLKRWNIKAVVDGKNFLNKKDLIHHGILYKGIGR